MSFHDLLETTTSLPKNQYQPLIETQKYPHCEAISFHYNSPSIENPKEICPLKNPKATDDRLCGHKLHYIYLYQISYFPVNKNIYVLPFFDEIVQKRTSCFFALTLLQPLPTNYLRNTCFSRGGLLHGGYVS